MKKPTAKTAKADSSGTSGLPALLGKTCAAMYVARKVYAYQSYYHSTALPTEAASNWRAGFCGGAAVFKVSVMVPTVSQHRACSRALHRS
ncbi:phenylacetate-coenzyme A ligase PaaK-like adenylate-forming protein [Streptomyces candidus]|uniref:Phenylacetate-coenzyme A ligase PaaK-like adenylate-forming protein n=1 Tax=Streptomyces candidus TaxID=67283 RepID=A0A7X0HBT3_9ACTN|nr:phenylacetate-coenzyme A ligase PaaK-like adenylate-forming protein [Streptomyces candidus]